MNILEEIAEKTKQRIQEEKARVPVGDLKERIAKNEISFLKALKKEVKTALKNSARKMSIFLIQEYKFNLF